jgi:hypothetical protein
MAGSADRFSIKREVRVTIESRGDALLVGEDNRASADRPAGQKQSRLAATIMDVSLVFGPVGA